MPKLNITKNLFFALNRTKIYWPTNPFSSTPDFSKPFKVTTDSSNLALGAVPSQGPIGQNLPISNTSCRLNDSETAYFVIERMVFAVIWAPKILRNYLYGQKFNIICDHKALKWLFSLRDPNPKLMRCRIKLEENQYNIIYMWW